MTHFYLLKGQQHIFEKRLSYTIANKINSAYSHLEILTASEPTASLHSNIKIALTLDLAG